MALISGLATLSPAFSKDKTNDNMAVPAKAEKAPDLIIAISVDQFSADLFAEYRSHFTKGMKRLADGVVFPSGYQSHAATETCPGHSTILTGAHPSRTGIIANDWIDLGTKRADKTVYCAEDETQPDTDSNNYVESNIHLLVPTLGDRLKQQVAGARNVAVAGKDRAAIMMGGHDLDAIYFWKGSGFTTLKGEKMRPEIKAFNDRLAPTLDAARPASPIPGFCAPHNRAIAYGNDGRTVGTYAYARPEGGGKMFRASPDFDTAILGAASELVESMKLGQSKAPDLLSIGLSATDYIGHSFGTEGLEMCLQMVALDESLGNFFAMLDARGIDYAVVLTADHGGHDLPERAREQAMPDAQRVDPALNAKAISDTIKAELQIGGSEPVLYSGGASGDYYISNALNAAQREAVKQRAMALISAFPQVKAVIDAKDLAAIPVPTGPVEVWTMAERARASYYPGRSGDFIVMLDKHVTPIANPTYYVATHGSPWDEDRRVPILFWRKGWTHFEQPLSVETVDIAPSLAPLLGVAIDPAEIDGRCLDLDAGPGSTCG